MTVHLSARLTWHDSGWDGTVCRDPLANASCVVHEHIRDSRDDLAEVNHAGQALHDLTFRPPCSRDPGAYSASGYRIEHRDPLDFRALPAVSEDLPAYSVATSPYGRMFAETGLWEYDPAKQLERLGDFFGELEAKRSFVFFYLKDGQPFVESSSGSSRESGGSRRSVRRSTSAHRSAIPATSRSGRGRHPGLSQAGL